MPKDTIIEKMREKMSKDEGKVKSKGPANTASSWLKKKKEEIHCDFCGLPNASELEGHQLLGDCNLCDECARIAYEELIKAEKKVDNVLTSAGDVFQSRVRTKQVKCQHCNGKGWMDV